MIGKSKRHGMPGEAGLGALRSRRFASVLASPWLIAALLMALLAMPATAGPRDGAANAPVSGKGVDLQRFEELPDGMVYAEFSNGVSAVAPRGSVVEYEERVRTNADGEEVSQAHADIRPPEVNDRPRGNREGSAMEWALRSGMIGPEQLDDVASHRREAGISKGQAEEMIAQGLDGSAVSEAGSDQELEASGDFSTTSMFDDGCLEIDNEKHWMYGCYQRYNGEATTAGNYYGQRSLATAKSKSHWMLVKARTHHDYGAGNGEVREWRPTAAVNRGECGEVSLGLNYKGANMSVSGNICPTKMEPSVGSKYFQSQWQSSWGAWRSARDTEALDVIYSPNTGDSGFIYRIWLESRA